MTLFHRHQWSKWKIVDAYEGVYNFGGGAAHVLIQQRICATCDKIQMNRQVA